MSVTILKDGDSVATADLDEQQIETEDAQLEEMFYQLADEGIPVAAAGQGSRGEIADDLSAVEMSAEYQPAFEFFIKKYGYEVEREQQDEPQETKDAMLGDVTILGLPIVIEHERNSERYGGKLPADYGYIRLTTSAEGADQMDCFVGTEYDSKKIFIIDSYTLAGKFDEHKIMFWFDDKDAALAAFRVYYNDIGQRRGIISPISEAAFKMWLAAADFKQPYHTPRDVKYTPSSKDTRAHCSLCKYYSDKTCMNQVVKFDPSVPEYPTGPSVIKIVSSGGWCVEFRNHV